MPAPAAVIGPLEFTVTLVASPFEAVASMPSPFALIAPVVVTAVAPRPWPRALIPT